MLKQSDFELNRAWETTSCTSCRFFSDANSQCRRNAPSPQGHRQIIQWPIVKPDDWCGEYKYASVYRQIDLFESDAAESVEERVLNDL